MPVTPRCFFELINKYLLQQGLGFVCLAFLNERAVAGAIFLHWQKTLTYKYGASTEEGLRNKENALLFWTAICWGIEMGYDTLDMGRSDLGNIGLREFKQRWGAEEIPLSYAYSPETPHPVAYLQQIDISP